MKDYLTLFLIFTKIGAVTFGGGLAMYPILKQEIAEKQKWLTDGELFDVFAIAQALPGIIAINTAAFVGYRRKGVLGAIIGAVGLILPSLIVITVIAVFFKKIITVPWVNSMFRGINVAVAAVLTIAVIDTAKKTANNIKGAIIATLSFFAVLLLNAPIPLIVLAGVAAGLFLVNDKELTPKKSGEVKDK